MTDLKDLVARLREHKDAPESPPTAGEFMQTVGAWIRRACELQAEAADAIERLSGKAEPPIAWMTDESLRRLECGGNESRGTVPVHYCTSSVARIPLYLHPAAPAPDDAAKLPDAVIDGIAQKCWPNDEWIGVRYIQFARAVERAVIAAMKEKP